MTGMQYKRMKMQVIEEKERVEDQSRIELDMSKMQVRKSQQDISHKQHMRAISLEKVKRDHFIVRQEKVDAE